MLLLESQTIIKIQLIKVINKTYLIFSHSDKIYNKLTTIIIIINLFKNLL